MSSDNSSSFYFLVIIIIGLIISFVLDGNLTGRYNELSNEFDDLQAEYDLLKSKYNSMEDDLCIVWSYFNEDTSYEDAHAAVIHLEEIYYGR